MGIVVTLTPGELLQAATVGTFRHVRALRRCAKGAHGIEHTQGDDWGYHIEGACGEYAAAKCTGLFWPVDETINGPDIGQSVQVRTRSRADYDLTIYPSDDDAATFVLVTGRAPTYTVVGFIRASDGKRPEYWREHTAGRPAYFVPQSALTPMDGRADMFADMFR